MKIENDREKEEVRDALPAYEKLTTGLFAGPEEMAKEAVADSGTYSLTTPVLFIGFNRIQTAERVFEVIRSARPRKLYFAFDGPRDPEESKRCDEVRALVQRVDWPCEVHTLANEHNKGLRAGVSAAISWFFKHEEEGIILEDDTLPAPTFFRFCQELLEYYRNDQRIWVIMGNNLMTDYTGEQDGSYYFSAHGYGAPWGWASWRRTWNKYDVNMNKWPALRSSTRFHDFFLTAQEKREMLRTFESVHSGCINSWSYQLDVTRVMGHGVNILPNTDLVRNIGFGGDATHTVSVKDRRNKDTVRDIGFPLTHPHFIMVDKRRDAEYFKRYIGGTRVRRFKDKVKKVLGGDNGKVVRLIVNVKRRSSAAQKVVASH